MKLRDITLSILAGLTLIAFGGGSAEALTEHTIASNLNVSIDSVSVKLGDKFSLNVSLSNIPSPGIAVSELGIDYDPKLVQITNIKEGAVPKGTGAAKAELVINPKLGQANTYSCFNYNISKSDGQICVSWLTGMANTNYWMKSDGIFFTIEGIVIAEEATTASFKIEPIHRADYPNALVFNQKVIFGYRDLAFETYDEYFYTYNTTDGKLKINQPQVTILGDINLDNKINVIDGVLLSQYICGKTSLSTQRLLNADINSDGIANIQDLVHIFKYIINKL